MTCLQRDHLVGSPLRLDDVRYAADDPDLLLIGQLEVIQARAAHDPVDAAVGHCPTVRRSSAGVADPRQWRCDWLREYLNARRRVAGAWLC
jgi:hypothetical protein